MILEIIKGILSLSIALLTFKYTFFSKPKKELEHLKIQFKATQKLSLIVQNEIENYIKNKNGENKLIFENITFQNYLELMKESFSENLSDKLLMNLDNLRLTKPTINSMTRSLEKQFSELQQINLKMNVLNKS